MSKQSASASATLLLLIWLTWLTMHCTALDWQQVKPMYLVSMYPGPMGLSTSSSSPFSSSSSSSLELDAEMSASNVDSRRIKGMGLDLDVGGFSEEDLEDREPLVAASLHSASFRFDPRQSNPIRFDSIRFDHTYHIGERETI